MASTSEGTTSGENARSSKYEQEVNRYMKFLEGNGIKGRYGNTNLVLLENGEQTIFEKTRNNISPPTNLNPDYYKPVKQLAKPKSKKKKQTNSSVDPAFLRDIYGR